MDGLGNNLSELKTRIRQIHDDLSRLGLPEPVMPEMMNTTNALRLNEYLTKSDEKKTSLIAAYGEYAQQLEQVVSALLSIQVDLKDIIKAEASIIDEQEPQTKAGKTSGTKKPKK